ncbi:hypothetical protein [Pimelobacter simplex]|uniref:hypothetical protein n=1 Tax=Nocardioides simplex TaxID=2045 RepID=UPI0019346DD1|nr:hypothetical protein [Pimelobacter simplex]
MTDVLARRVAGFAVATLAPALSGVVLLAVLARHVAAAEWAAVALGQSVGLLAALVVSCGWTLVGPSAVAVATAAERRGLYESALRSRTAVLAASLPLAVATGWLILPAGGRGLGLAVLAAMMLTGLSPRWFLVGTGDAGQLLRFEGGPIVVANLAAALALVLGAPVIVYPTALAVAAVGAVAAFTARVRRQLPSGATERPGDRRTRVAATATEVVGGVYSTANVALVATQVTVAAVAGYASGWRLYQWGMVVLVGVCQALQGWVAVEPSARPRRFRIALAAHAALGLLGLLAFAVVGGPLTELLFGSDLRVPEDVSIALGLAFFFLSLNTSLGRHVLATSRRVRELLVSTVLGAAVGVPAVLLLSAAHGAAGGAVGLAGAEAVVCGYQAVVARALLRHG